MAGALRMLAIPPNVLPGDPDLLRWFEDQGIDPHTVSAYAIHWTQMPDGTFALHYLEYVLDEQGQRILCPSPEDDYRYGLHAEHVKRPRLVSVGSVPAMAVEVAR